MIWGVVLLALVLSFLLSGCEAAVLSVSRVRVRHAASEGDAKALRLLPLLEDRDSMLGAVTVANHITNLVAFSLVLIQFVHRLGPIGYATAFALGLPIFLVGLEVLPKKLFRRYPFRSLRAVLPMLRFVGAFRFLFRVFIPKGAAGEEETENEAVVREDLRSMATLLATKSLLSRPAEMLIHRVLGYRQKKVRDLMVPLTHRVALAPDVPIAMAFELARSHEVEAIPVLGEDGTYIGVFEPALCGGHVPEDRLVRQHMRTLEHVREDETGLRVLQRLRKRGRTVALVLNANEVPSGMITEEDLLRPLLSASGGGLMPGGQN